MKIDYKAILKHTGFVIILIVVLGSCEKKVDDQKTTVDSSISIAELRDHMYYLASDELAGRMPGENGYDAAAVYCATQFRQAGLSPICRSTEGNLTYLQKVEILKKTRKNENKLWMNKKTGKKSFHFGDEYFFASFGEKNKINLQGPMAFVGYGIHEPDHGWDDYKDVDVRGKWAVYIFGVPREDGKFILPEALSDAYADGLRGYQLKGQTAVDAGAIGVVIICNEERFKMWDVLRHATRTTCTLPGIQAHFQPPCVQVFLNKEPLNRLFEDRPYNPISAEGEYGSFAMDDLTLDLEAAMAVETIESSNVVALVEGTDPKLNHEFITIGAHLDHVGREEGLIFNGADDNASGSVAILEAAEAVALNPPKRSTIFILYTGEELRFMGSQYFVLNPPVPLENIICNINLDMVGRPDGDAEELSVMTAGNIKAELDDIISSINDSHTHLPLDFGNDKFIMMSDQVSFFLEGIPVVFFNNGDHDDIHQSTDDAEKINFVFLKTCSQLTYYLIMDLADGV